MARRTGYKRSPNGTRFRPELEIVSPGVHLSHNGTFKTYFGHGYIGTFDTLDEALAARAKAGERNNAKLGYVPPEKGMSPERFVLDRIGYDPETGEFTWKVVQRHSRPVGSRAGYRTVKGYRYLGFKLDGKTHAIAEHRAAFLIMTGALPALPVDHINGIRDDNRWENLREVTPKQNAANIAVKAGRSVIRINGRFYPLIGEGYATHEEAALVAETM